MELKIEEIKKGEKIAPENLDKYGKDEIERVTNAIEDAKKRLIDLSQSKLLTREKAAKCAELNYAIAVGSIYLTKLKNKYGHN